MRFLGLGNGRHGKINLSTYTQTWYAQSGIVGAYTVNVTGSFSPGDRVFLYQGIGTGVGQGEDNTVASYVAGTLTLVHPLENTYTNSGASVAQIAVVKEASSTYGSYDLPAFTSGLGGGLVIACNGELAGTINGLGKGYRGGDGSIGVGTIGQQGQNTTGVQNRSTSANDIGGGGGPAQSSENGGNAGAGGAHATAGSNGTGSTGATTTVGSADLSAGIFMGGGGGGAGSRDTNNYNAGLRGRHGGGFVILYAYKITANVNVDGESESALTGAEYPGGAGAGGTIFTKSVINQGTYSAIGGTGGSRTAGGGTSGDGGDGRIRHESCEAGDTSDPVPSLVTGGHSYCSSILQMI